MFFNVVAGFRLPLGETSMDLAMLAAVTSSITNTPIPPGTALLAGVGLAGELQPVPNIEVHWDLGEHH
jgi:DNA repair protein RadA/Sms